MVKNMPANTGDARDVGLILGPGRSLAVRNGKPLSSTFTWKIPWTKEPGGLQSIESERVRNDSNHLDAGIHFLGLRSWNQW